MYSKVQSVGWPKHDLTESRKFLNKSAHVILISRITTIRLFPDACEVASRTGPNFEDSVSTKFY